MGVLLANLDNLIVGLVYTGFIGWTCYKIGVWRGKRAR